ncbi:hypothetical protein M0R01_00080 [bacterium]|nr:hypothetical protein [bacterium]
MEMIEHARDVLRSVIEIGKEQRNFEISRVVAKTLMPYGNFRIKDGTVTYSFEHLLQNYLPPTISRNRKLRKRLLKKRSLKIFHSWCEWEVKGEGTIIIDYHHQLELDGDIISDLLIVDYKENLPYKYESSCIGFGKFLFLRNKFFPKIIHLRT